jgi:hypothetical protein
MPLVTVGSVTVEYQLGLVKDGAIQHIAGYLPGDDDSPIPTIFKDLQPGTKVNKSGLNLTATPFAERDSAAEVRNRPGEASPVHDGGLHGRQGGRVSLGRVGIPRGG